MPMDRGKYPPDWEEISYRIRFERANGVCEWCGAEHGEPHPVTGSVVILTVHHIGIDKPDGTPGDREDKLDCREENLAALCQRCHLNADMDMHQVKAARTRHEKKYQTMAAVAAGQRSLFDEQ